MLDSMQEIQNYLLCEMKMMEKVTAESLDVEEELITVIGNHLSKAGGKRIRSLLTILVAKMFSYEGENVIKIATAIEFIHMATLLHDDVVDESKMRRSLPTANSIWGNKASILVGDFLFSQAFRLIVSTKIIKALESLSNASAIIAQGEVAQLTALAQKRITSEDEYYKVIKAKTAELFSVACEVGIVVAKQDIEVSEMRKFGLCLGNIFQIADDVLDYFSNKEKIGKNIGEDFDEGKVTLPLIILAQKIDTSGRDRLNKMLQADHRSQEQFTWVKEQMIELKVQDTIRQHLERIRLQAIEHLDKYHNIQTIPKQHIKSLLDFAIERTY